MKSSQNIVESFQILRIILRYMQIILKYCEIILKSCHALWGTRSAGRQIIKQLSKMIRTSQNSLTDQIVFCPPIVFLRPQIVKMFIVFLWFTGQDYQEWSKVQLFMIVCPAERVPIKKMRQIMKWSKICQAI